MKWLMIVLAVVAGTLMTYASGIIGLVITLVFWYKIFDD